MKFHLITAAILAAPALALDTKVTVTEGPTECIEEEKVSAGNFLSMHYTGTIDESSATGEKGSKFDSSLDRGQTFDFKVGTGQVIAGWDQGLIGLCKGAKATLVIPPSEGYGESGAGGAIPGGATLNFVVEVVDVSTTGPAEPNFFTQIDTDENGVLSKEEVEAYFKQMGADMPAELWDAEDKNGDGVIDWEEFSGPKGDEPPTVKAEL